MTFDEPEPGVTISRLTQTEVPDEDRLFIYFLFFYLTFLKHLVYLLIWMPYFADMGILLWLRILREDGKI